MTGNGNGHQRISNIGILVFNEVRVLDFAGAVEAFAAVRLDESRRMETLSPFRTVLIAQDTCAVRAQGGLRLLPDYPLDHAPALDVLIVPGGRGTHREVDNLCTIDWLRQNAQSELICGIAAGTALLARAGLLSGRRATTHARSAQWLRQLSPDIRLEVGTGVVKDGNVWTAGNTSAGIDLALEVVRCYLGDAVALAAARHVEYPPPFEAHQPGWLSAAKTSVVPSLKSQI